MAAYSGAPDAVDFSFDRIPGKTLAANGIELAARYLSHTAGKNLTAAEAQDLRTHGVGVLLNWESAAGRPLLGASGGAADGHDAAAYAESIGAPHGLTIYYSCDRDITSSQYAAIVAYYQAAKDATAGRYKVGVYGEFEIVEELHRRGVVDGEWQTYAWSGGKLSTQTDLYQYRNGQRLAGAAVDFDHIIHASELGAWWPDGHTPAGGGTPITEDDMTYSDWPDAARKALTDDVASAVVARGVAPYNGTLAAILNDIRNRIVNVGVKVGALGDGAGGTVDAHAVAQEIIAGLGPDLAHQVLVALNAALPNQ